MHQKRLVYTRRDVQHVIEYAYKRGVRVIPEIDMVNLKLYSLGAYVYMNLNYIIIDNSLLIQDHGHYLTKTSRKYFNSLYLSRL